MERQLAPFDFSDGDSGSGAIHSSPSLGPVRAAIQNIAARNLHEIGTAVQDDRQFLRAWRRQLQECVSQSNNRTIKFLLADVSGAAISESELARRCNDVLTKYSKPTWNFGCSIRDLSLPTAMTGTMDEITREIGVTPGDLRESMRRAIRLYVNTATELSAAEGRMEEKLKRLETVVGRINELMFMEPTPELEALAEPTRAYLDSVLEKISLDEEYQALAENYKKFSVLRSLVTLQGFQRTMGPTCSICMAKEVTQALTPCGHTYCDDCALRQQTACYICRIQVRDKVRLFFS
jgi:hypothetical protein